MHVLFLILVSAKTGLEGSSRPMNDDLEHSGTSQDDGKPFRHFRVSKPCHINIKWTVCPPPLKERST